MYNIPTKLILDLKDEVEFFNQVLRNNNVLSIETDTIIGGIFDCIQTNENVEFFLNNFFDCQLGNVADIYSDEQLINVFDAMLILADKIIMKVNCLGMYVNGKIPYNFEGLYSDRNCCLSRSMF